MFLCGNPLPWVTEGLYLGYQLTNKYDGMQTDILQKRGKYIQRNCELQQEFSFCHPSTKFTINNIYNSSMMGSQIWNLFSKQAEMLENSWNVSVRTMFNLPMRTHRYFIEQISQYPHLKVILIKRFLSFIEKIRNGRKSILKHILEAIELDCRSTTGNNLRQIMLLVGKDDIRNLQPSDSMSIRYHPIKEDDAWKVSLIQELVELKTIN